MDGYKKFDHPSPMEDSERLIKAAEFARKLSSRRSIRDYSDKPVSRDIIEACLRAAGTAPSGANRQPWHFAAINSPQIKQKIRQAAEKEECEFYAGRAGDDWLNALKHLGTNNEKPFLEIAPWLIVVFEQRHEMLENNTIIQNYYTRESVGLATGFLLAALHECGLSTLTYTPSPMVFLRDILKRPKTERAFMLIVTGLANDEALVPIIEKKDINDTCSFFL
jgi:iodotyrosine deiodinase